MLKRIDRVFATIAWLECHPFHFLRCHSTDCSDHAPLLLALCTEPWAMPRFCFESFWPQIDGFLDVVAEAWNYSLQNADVCRSLDYKLCRVAKALKRWSAQCIGSIRLQLAIARVVIYELEVAQESRLLSNAEVELHQDLKRATLGLASLSRTIARQKSRCHFLKDVTPTPNSSTCRPAIGSVRASFCRSPRVTAPSLLRKQSQVPFLSTMMACWVQDFVSFIGLI